MLAAVHGDWNHRHDLDDAGFIDIANLGIHETSDTAQQTRRVGKRLDKCISLLQCSEWILASWGAREIDLLGCDRCSRSGGDRLVATHN